MNNEWSRSQSVHQSDCVFAITLVLNMSNDILYYIAHISLIIPSDIDVIILVILNYGLIVNFCHIIWFSQFHFYCYVVGGLLLVYR